MPVNVNEVPDCVFYGDSATDTWSELATDDSGVGTNLSTAANSAYESSSARANLINTRTVDCHVDSHSNTTLGYLWTWDRGGGDYSSLRVSLGNVIATWDGGVTEEVFSPGNITGASDEFVIVWTMEPYPDSQGASDARYSELHVFNLSQSLYEIHSWTHAAESGTATGDLIFGASDTSNSNSYQGDVLEIRLSSALHSSAETFETFVNQSSAPTLDGNEYAPIPMPDKDQVNIGDDGNFAGPILIMGGKSAEQHRMLMAGPVVSDASNDTGFINTHTYGSKTVGYLYDGFRLRMEHLYYRPIPIGVTHVVPNLHIQYDYTGGGGTPVMNVRVYSMSQPGPVVAPANSPPEFIAYYVAQSFSTDQGNGILDGDWHKFNPLKIARNRIGWSYFCVATDVESGSNQSFRVRSVSIDPIVDLAGDGLGLGGLNG